MNDQQLAAERAALEVWAANDAEHGGNISKLNFLAGYRAAIAQREPVAEGEVSIAARKLRIYDPHISKEANLQMQQAAELLERTEAARLAAERQAEVMRHDFTPLQEFRTKYALGPMLPPSCLVCGQQTVPSVLELPQSVAIKHAELPGIVVCKSCAEAKVQLTAERARSEKLVDVLNRIADPKTFGLTIGILKSWAFYALAAYQSSKEAE